jgi:PAS domain S-box-containing protein
LDFDRDGAWHVLIVEDDTDTASMTSKLIDRAFHASINVAEDCASARERMAEDRFDVVILDYHLPDGNGLELLREISKTQDPPSVIMVTGEGDEETAAEAFRLHASGYLVKDKRLPTMLPEVIGGALAEISLRRAQEELRKSEERFRSIFEESPVGIQLYDTEGRLLDANDASLRIFGVKSVSEVKGLKLFEDPNITDKIKEKLRGHETVRYEADFDFEGVRELGLFETSGSGKITLEVSVTPLKHAIETPLGGYLVHVQDVTLRKQAEDALRGAKDELEERVKERTAELEEANEALRTEVAERKRAQDTLRTLAEQVQQQASMMDEILSTSPDHFYLIDSNGKFIYGSRAAAEMLGIKQEDIAGRYWWDLGFPAEVMRPFDVQREAVFTSGEPQRGYLRFPTAHGLRDYEYILSPIHRPDGQIGAVVATGRDITEHNEVKEALERHAAKLEEQAQLLDLTHDMILVRDMNSVIIFWNRGAEETYGWKREEALGKVSHELLKTRFPRPLEEIEFELLHEGRWEGEVIHATRDGRQLVESSRWALKWGEDHRPEAILEINNEITESKRLQEAELLDLFPLPVIVRDMNNSIILWNGAAAERYDWSRQEAIGKNCHELLGTRFPKPIEEIEFDLLESGRWHGELVHTARDGTEIAERSEWVLRWGDRGESSAIMEMNQTLGESRDA